MSATTPTGTPYTHCCEPTAMYQATGNSSSCANTATPRPHRRPVHSAHAAASTPPNMIANQAAVPNLFRPASFTAETAHDVNHRRHETGSPLECDQDRGLADGRGCGEALIGHRRYGTRRVRGYWLGDLGTISSDGDRMVSRW